MSDNSKIQKVREGYQPTHDEVTKGYRVTQPVDSKNLRIPKNLGDAAVTPQNSSQLRFRERLTKSKAPRDYTPEMRGCGKRKDSLKWKTLQAPYTLF